MSEDTNQAESQTSTNQQQTSQNSDTPPSDAVALAARAAEKAAAGNTAVTPTAEEAAATLAAAAAATVAAEAAADKGSDEDAIGVTTGTNTETDAEALAATAAAKAAAGKEESTTTSDSGAPDSYSDFDLPEGIEMNKGYMDRMGPLYKEFGLTQEQAQKLITAQVGYVQEGEKGRTDQVEALHTSWLNEAKADKDIGGDKFDASLKAANLAVNKFGGKELKTLLRSTGLGQHPEIIRVFSNIGSLLKEDSPGSTQLKVVGKTLTNLELLYPDDQPKESAVA